MHHHFIAPTVLMTLLALCPCALATAEGIPVPDANLAAALKATLQHREITGEAFQADDLANVYILHASNKGIKDLSGLEYCENLAELRLDGNSISDVTPLAGCQNLQSLDLAENQIVSIDALATLVKLQYLNVEGNQIAEVTAISHMEPLRVLYADRNRVRSLWPLADLPHLHSLHMAENEIVSILPLVGLSRLDTIGLAGNRIERIWPLQRATPRYTDLRNNQLESLDALVRMARRDAMGRQRFVAFWRLQLEGNPALQTERGQHALEELRELGVRIQ